MDLEELRALLAIAETGSVTAAAKSLNFARATLRKRIDEMEKKTGQSLLTRAADGATMTQAGAQLVEKGRGLLSDARSLVDALRELNFSQEALGLELPPGIPTSFEISALRNLGRLFPAVRWRVHYTEDPATPREETSIVIHVGRSALLHSPLFLHSALRKVRRGLLVSPDYFEDALPPQTPQDLSQWPLYYWHCPGSDPENLPIKNQAALPILPRVISSSAAITRRSAASGLGIAFAPAVGLGQLFERESKLIRLFAEEVGDEIPVWISVRAGQRGQKMRPLVEALSRLMVGTLFEDD